MAAEVSQVIRAGADMSPSVNTSLTASVKLNLNHAIVLRQSDCNGSLFVR